MSEVANGDKCVCGCDVFIYTAIDKRFCISCGQSQEA